MFFKVATLAQLNAFDEIIDVRSPSEFAVDHLPGAISCPVLDDAERARVGTLYCQQSPFAARRVGAALVARNIALHIEERFHDRPKSWRPLVYCWRGGQRSGAMALVLAQVGWAAHQLEHGYKGYRQQVLADLEQLPAGIDWRVLTGPTGSGKSRLLAALARHGRQVLDLEGLASHRGSVLGLVPGQTQPSQKAFESALRQALIACDGREPVYIEAESRHIGRLTLPNALLAAMQSAPAIRLEVPLAERVRFLLEDYAFLTEQPALLTAQLDRLKTLYAREQWDAWQRLIQSAQYAELVQALLEAHYDPLYRRSTAKHFAAETCTLTLAGVTDDALEQASSVL
ncbi:MAG: tRNA 2-selenouridine(34) synthase MnmH [Paludibacterium sp.]|uniref:tRNA 2-selenouridine(34) synthase MnmH n=1 Tax=Paludibacterium sp. TaxID=1917523 RepID=UPI0025F85C07|nr:tRNA 2-selenouridine(34) synthase MnmH [Paludibacterium sp.]MBV8048228.1 tRNA 2-selenouridine(34) synthase MnmH [Paludibacterium sp.]MBV8469538.1 tRNA 2-selenouridine(34) synthase MnmH [Burkholderiaceae bacterium]MBV8647100.1 tRNA 2-selenouridine(34) synthase MnmH [Paludibacterium sp.]